MVESMQQSSATPSLHLGFLGLRKIVACSQPYLAVASCIYSFWHGVIPTSYFIFNGSVGDPDTHSTAWAIRVMTSSKHHSCFRCAGSDCSREVVPTPIHTPETTDLCKRGSIVGSFIEKLKGITVLIAWRSSIGAKR